LTTWYCILSAELTKTHYFRLLAILTNGFTISVLHSRRPSSSSSLSSSKNG